jgi:hypothetical protein
MTFRRLFDPVLDGAGHVAFLALIDGPGVTLQNERVVVSNGRNGVLEVLARAGSLAPGANGAVFQALLGVSIKEGISGGGLPASGSQSGIVILASLQRGTGSPIATLANDTGAWWLPAGGSEVQKLVREGDAGFVPRERIKTFRILKAIDASYGQGRGQSSGDEVVLQLGFNTGRHALANATPGLLTELARSGDKLGGSVLPAAVWYKMGLPSSGKFGEHISVFGTLREGPGVPRTGVRGIFTSDDAGATWQPLVRTGVPSPGVDRGVFLAFSEPVNSSSGAGIAFLAATRGRGVLRTNNEGLWWRPEGGALTLLAREGSQPPGAPAGAKWRVFNSLALPGGATGPLFTATLQIGAGGITSTDDFGLYGVDGSGTLRELVRENQPLLGMTVKTFTVLRAIVGIEGTTRAFNATAAVVLLVTFTDNSTAIVKIDLGSPPPGSP